MFSVYSGIHAQVGVSNTLGSQSEVFNFQNAKWLQFKEISCAVMVEQYADTR
jgi:hypothetical protein